MRKWIFTIAGQVKYIKRLIKNNYNSKSYKKKIRKWKNKRKRRDNKEVIILPSVPIKK